MKTTWFKTGTAALAVTALVAAGCGGDDEEETASTGTTAAMSEPAAKESSEQPTETGASELRATLTAGLQEHVYLAGIAISQGVGEGLDSDGFKAAAATLDNNSKNLSDAIGSVYGKPAGKQFLAIWRDHIGMFVDYAGGNAGAKKDLDRYRAEFGAFLEGANPNLTKEAVAEELKPHVASVIAVVDSAKAKDGKTYDLLKEAASHMPQTANVLAGAIAKQMPEKFAGSTETGAAELRAGLTGLLNEHVYLAALALQDEKAVPTLDKNSVALSEAIGSVYGAAAGKQFLALWREHIGFFVNYTKGDKGARADLDGYRAEFGAFLEGANPNLTKEAVADELVPHVDSVIAVIDSLKAKDGKTYDLLQEAASHMPQTANVLAGAIAKQFPKKFPAS